MCSAAAAILIAALVVFPATTAAAQERTPPAGVQAPRPAPRDSLAAAISPRGAFLRSFVLPSWGQFRLGRPLAGAIFLLAEGGAAAMVVKTHRSLDEAKAARGDTIVIGFETNPDGTPRLGDDGEPIPILAQNPLAGNVESRRQQFEDWLAILVFNHLFAGADAFVSAHLGNLPERVAIRPRPGGGIVMSASLAW